MTNSTAVELDTVQALAARISRLEAIEEIKRLKASYFRYLDLHWWVELRSLFTHDATFDILESAGQPKTVEEFLGRIETHLTTALTVHHGHMPEIELRDEDHAHGVWSMFDLVEPRPGTGYPVLTGFGHYTEEYRRVDGQWRIASLRLTRLKRSVDDEVVDGAEVDGRRLFREP